MKSKGTRPQSSKKSYKGRTQLEANTHQQYNKAGNRNGFVTLKSHTHVANQNSSYNSNLMSLHKDHYYYI